MSQAIDIFGGEADDGGYAWPDPKLYKLRSGRQVWLVPHLITDVEGLERMAAYVSTAPIRAYDTEGSGLKPSLGARICGHSLGCYDHERRDVIHGFYVPVRHMGGGHVPNMDPEVVAPYIGRVLQAPGKVVGHHLKFDAMMAAVDGIEITAEWEDSSIGAQLHNENLPSMGLKPLAEHYLFEGARSEEKEMGRWMKSDARRLGMPYKKLSTKQRAEDPLRKTYLQTYGYARAPVNLCGGYACVDVFETLLLEEVFRDTVKTYWDAYQLDIETSKVLGNMEYVGNPISIDEIHKAGSLLEEEREHWLGVMRDFVGDPEWKPSDPALADFLYRQKKYAVLKRTEKDQSPSTDSEARKLLAAKYPEIVPFMKAYSAWTKAEKLHSTYVIPFLRFAAPNGMIHSSYNQLEQREKDRDRPPVTGRMSSADPNMQNIAAKATHMYNCRCKKCVLSRAEAEGVDISLDVVRDTLLQTTGLERSVSVRRYYPVPEGYIRVFIDLSQIELRGMAWFTRDPVLLRCYREGIDVHQQTGDIVAGGNRSTGKTVNFTQVYGAGPRGVAVFLKGYYTNPEAVEEEAKGYLRKFNEGYAAIGPWKTELARRTVRNGCLFVSPFGRPRHIPDLRNGSTQMRSRAERQLVSTAVQGTCASLIKKIMLRCGAYLEANVPGARMSSTIHDEIAFDIPNRAGWVGHVRSLVTCFTDWPIFTDVLPIEASVEVTTTTWEAKREMLFLPDGSVGWAA